MYYTQESSSIELHKHALEIINECDKKEMGPTFFLWSENCFFGYAIHLNLLNKHEQTLEVCKTYLASTKYHISPLKKIALIDIYIQILLYILDDKPPLNGIPKFESVISATKIDKSKQQIMQTIRDLLPSYEKLLTDVCPFPHGEEQNEVWIRRNKRIEKCYHWWIQVEMHEGRFQDDLIGDVIDRYYRTLEVFFYLSRYCIEEQHILLIPLPFCAESHTRFFPWFQFQKIVFVSMKNSRQNFR